MGAPRWQELHKGKIVTPEHAAAAIRSGDTVIAGMGPLAPISILRALADRRDELRGVKLTGSSASTPLPFWTEPGWEESILAAPNFTSPITRPGLDQRFLDFMPVDYHLMPKVSKVDVVLTTVSAPDRNGYCSFGGALWYHKPYVYTAREVIAEVDDTFIHTFGDNHIHVSDIDYLVERREPAATFNMREAPGEAVPSIRATAKNAASLIEDGDTFQIGTGIISVAVAEFLLDRKDLGIHSEIMPQSMVELVLAGVANGRRKTLHPHKAVSASLTVPDPDLMEAVNGNPAFELYSLSYVTDPRVIAAHDNMVAVNTALAIDLSGQVAAESLGHRIWSGAGGQFNFVLGAMLSKGGRSVTVLQSTARGGAVTRIVPRFEPGTLVTVPRNYVDYVVTEHGIVRLSGKTQRERAEALISIADPQFRDELWAEARRLYWPSES